MLIKQSSRSRKKLLEKYGFDHINLIKDAFHTFRYIVFIEKASKKLECDYLVLRSAGDHYEELDKFLSDNAEDISKAFEKDMMVLNV